MSLLEFIELSGRQRGCFLSVLEEHEADSSFLNNLYGLMPWRWFLSILVNQSTAGSADVSPSGPYSGQLLWIFLHNFGFLCVAALLVK